MKHPGFNTKLSPVSQAATRSHERRWFAEDLEAVPGCGTTDSPLLQAPVYAPVMETASLSAWEAGHSASGGEPCGTVSQSLKGFNLMQPAVTRHLVLGTEGTAVNSLYKNPAWKGFTV